MSFSRWIGPYVLFVWDLDVALNLYYACDLDSARDPNFESDPFLASDLCFASQIRDAKSSLHTIHKSVHGVRHHQPTMERAIFFASLGLTVKSLHAFPERSVPNLLLRGMQKGTMKPTPKQNKMMMMMMKARTEKPTAASTAGPTTTPTVIPTAGPTLAPTNAPAVDACSPTAPTAAKGSAQVACAFLDISDLRTCCSTTRFDDKTVGTIIPTEIGLLTQLGYLDLYNNALTSTIPTEIGLLTQLTLLAFLNNNLMGTIPSSLCSLPSLVPYIFIDCGEITCASGCCKSEYYGSSCG